LLMNVPVDPISTPISLPPARPEKGEGGNGGCGDAAGAARSIALSRRRWMRVGHAGYWRTKRPVSTTHP
jgi:hypothetical protein